MLLAVIVKLFATEPERRAEPGAIESDEQPSVWQGLQTILSNRAAMWLVAAITITSMIGYALTGWTPAYLIRSFEMTTLQIGNIVAPLLAIAGVASGLGSGWLANRLSEKYGMHAQSLMVAGLKTLALPFLIAFYLVESAWMAVGVYFLALFFQSCYLGPTFAMIQTLAPLKMRAVWAAVTLLIINLIGLGIGPTMVGIISDMFVPQYGEQSLRYALLVIASFTPLAIFCYWRAAVALRRPAQT